MSSDRYDQTGGIFLELVLFFFILGAFAAGTARVHQSLSRRFAAIVRERNEAVRTARGAFRISAP
jgi:hypothetical protein